MPRLLLIALMIAAAGCQAIPSYHPPVVNTPCSWKGPHADEAEEEPIRLEHWWEVFHDPQLNQLEKLAVANNQTLKAGFEKLAEAKAIAWATRADLYPNIALAPDYLSQGMLTKNPNRLGGPNLIRFHQMQHMLPLEISYEADLFGKLCYGYRAGLANAESVREALFSLLLSITTDIAQSYYRLKAFDSEIKILEKAIALREEEVAINAARYEAGLINYADVTRAEVEAASARAEKTNVERQRAIEENILAVLCGIPASDFSLPFSPLEDVPPTIPPGLPSDLLCRRPDILELERTMAKLHAEAGIAYASFFPSLTLTGALGLASPQLSSLFTWKARFWSIGASALQTLFDAGKKDADWEASKARFKEAIANYQQQTLVAFREVEDALAGIKDRRVQESQLQQAINAGKTTSELSVIRFEKGLVNYLEVVDAQRQLLESQRSAAIIAGDRFISTVQLIKALGGGW